MKYRIGRVLALAVGATAILGTVTGRTPAALAAGPAPAHPLVIVYMENQGLSQILADPGDMPYLNSLWDDPASEQFTSYYAVDHPSFPNYSAFAAGKEESTGTQADNVKAGEFTDPTVWDQLTSAGDSWRVYMEAMPSTCYSGGYYDNPAAGGPYKIGHNPAVPWAGVYNTSECQNVQPLSAMNDAALPAVSFVAPDLCDDMHGVPSTDPNGYQDCVTGTVALEQRSDSWLASEVPAWAAAGADVFITFDEGSGNGNQVYAVLTGPGVEGGHNPAVLSHYSLLAGVEDAFGLPLLGNAATATPVVFPGVTPPPPPVSACPAIPLGDNELSANVSLETSQAGWTGVYTQASKVVRDEPSGGSFDGQWALGITNTSATTAATGVNNASPLWAGADSVAGDTYTASAAVRGTPGTTVDLMLRETTPSGAGVGYRTTSLVLPDSGWHVITTAYAAHAAGDTVKYSLYAPALPAGGSFQADCLEQYMP